MPRHRIVIDTMYAIDLLADERMKRLAELIREGTVQGIISVITITELVKILGQIDEAKMKATLDSILSSELVVADVTYGIARLAGELRLNCSIPTGDSLIAATGIHHGATNILTDDDHFVQVKKAIKPIGYRQLMRLVG